LITCHFLSSLNLVCVATDKKSAGVIQIRSLHKNQQKKDIISIGYADRKNMIHLPWTFIFPIVSLGFVAVPSLTDSDVRLATSSSTDCSKTFCKLNEINFSEDYR
jgi:hypothetical protein